MESVLSKQRVPHLKARFSKYTGLMYILPWIIGFTVLQFYAIATSLYYSFTDYSMGKNTNWVGLQNYIDIFTKDYDFAKSARVTFIYVLIAVPLKLLFALFIAVVLNQKLRGINLFRTAYYIPSILTGSVSIAILWKALFLKDGYVNVIFSYLGIPPVSWYGTPTMALFTISLLTVWQFGSSMVLFLAGLQQIPNSLYEAGRVDGAGKLKQFFKITLPMLSPTIFFNIIMQTINAFQEFTSPAIVTHGGPVKGTYLYGLKLYEEGFQNFRMGYACSLSWLLFIVIMIFTLVMFTSSSRWVYYADGGEDGE